MLEQEALARFQEAFRGRLVWPSDPAYDETRQLYNGMIDKRPRLIASCSDVADVIAAVGFARDTAMLVAVRGGGHNGPGLGSCDGGLVIDLGNLKGIRIDPSAGTVQAEAGCTQGDIEHAASAFGLAVPAGIVSTTGVAGLTLGGGHGYLTRRYGLTIDNLLAADVVLADGRLVTASEREHQDLFWALRGGGGNFGVVTSFLFQGRPVTMVHAGPMFWPIEQAPEIMRFYRDFLPTAPERLCAFLGLKSVPSTAPFPEDLWGRRICALIVCCDGTAAAAEADLRPIREGLPAPLLDGVAEMPFQAVQSMFDPLLPPGMQWYWKGDFVDDLTDEAIAVHVEHGRRSPSELSLMHLYPIDGAVHRVDPAATAWSCRDARWSMVIAGIDPDPAGADKLKRWGRAYWEAVHPFNRRGAYVNFLMDDEDEGRLRASYGANYERLAAAKRTYDPMNLFRVNQNIRPAA